MLRSKREFEVGNIFLAEKKNTVVFSDNWASNMSKQNSSARRFSSSAQHLKCDSYSIALRRHCLVIWSKS